MTMLSFRIDPAEAARAREAAHALGIPQSEMIREALRRYLNAIAAQRDAAAYDTSPFGAQELSLIEAERWAPAEDWSDWVDAAG